MEIVFSARALKFGEYFVSLQHPMIRKLYIYDTENKIENRISTFSFDDGSKELIKLIIEKLINILNKNNQLINLL